MRLAQPLFRIGALALLLGTLLAACVMEDEGPGPGGPSRPFPPDRPQFCSRQYDPVCATRGNNRQTFPNGCQAEAAGFRILRDGQCRDDGWGGSGGQGGFCSRQYDPVCARRGSGERTFSNSCEADNAGFRAIYNGECRGSGPGPAPGPIAAPQPAPVDPGPRAPNCRSNEPVCAKRGGLVRTFPNYCEAAMARFQTTHTGPC